MAMGLTGCSLMNSGGDIHVYVAPHGDDDNPGTQRRPVATLVRARDIIRLIRQGADRTPVDGGDFKLWHRQASTFLTA